MARSKTLYSAIVLLSVLAPRAEAVVINSNTTIDEQNSFPNESVVVMDGANPPTVVDILHGAIIGPSSSGSVLSASDNSIVTIFGGTINGAVRVIENATINLVDLNAGTALESVSASVNATFNMSGGQVGRGMSSDHEIRVSSGSPTLNISGGVIMGWVTTQNPSSATINLTGGQITESLRMQGNATANWWGGGPSRSSVWDDSQLHVYGFGLVYDNDRLTGVLADGTPTDTEIIIAARGGTAAVILHEVTDTPGDTFPLDGMVDIVDLNRVRNHFGAGHIGGDPVPGDTFPFDGAVDMNDLNRVRNRFGTNRPATPVPEPATATMLLLSITGLFAASRWRPTGA